MGPTPVRLVSLMEEEILTYKETRDACTQRKGQVRTKGEGVCLQAKDMGRREKTKPAGSLILNFQPQEL